jgi:hypothetical protein
MSQKIVVRGRKVRAAYEDGQLLTATGGNPRESAIETRPPLIAF